MKINTDFYKRKAILAEPFILLALILFPVTFYIVFSNNRTGSDQGVLEIQNAMPQKRIRSNNYKLDVFLKGNPDIKNFDFTQYAKVGNRVERTFTVSGKKAKTANPKFGIFRIAIGKVVEIEEPKLTIYKNDIPISFTSSTYGKIGPLQDGLEFFKNVQVTTNDNRILKCRSLTWKAEDEHFVARGDCILVIDNKVIKSSKIETDAELEDFSKCDT